MLLPSGCRQLRNRRLYCLSSTNIYRSPFSRDALRQCRSSCWRLRCTTRLAVIVAQISDIRAARQRSEHG